MALAFTITGKPEYVGKYKRVSGTIAWDSSYPTGGEDYSTGLGSDVLELNCPPYLGYSFQPDYTNKKILAYALATAGGAAAAGTDALSIKSSVLSRESASASTAPLNEVHNTKDLSGLTAAPFTALLRI